MKKTLFLALITTLLGILSVGITTSAESYNNLEYEISNGEVTITDYTGASTSSLIIPAEINGYPVTAIGNSAFYYNKKFSSITLPDSITSIGDGAFSTCSVKRINIPDSVTHIGKGAFYKCKFTSITLPDSITTINDSTFSNCKNLISVTLGNNVTSIGSNAFYSCTSLININIPDSVTFIGDDAFSNCTALTNINLGQGITMIGNYSFGECYALTSIVLPASLTTIDVAAFLHCDNLTDIYYKGTEAEWNSINISLLNDPLTNTTKHYGYNKTEQYTYKFLDSDGSVLKEETADYGTIITAPKPTDNPLYIFDYWEGFSEGTRLTSDITFTAKYNKYDGIKVITSENGKKFNVISAYTYHGCQVHLALYNGTRLVEAQTSVWEMANDDIGMTFTTETPYTTGKVMIFNFSPMRPLCKYEIIE